MKKETLILSAMIFVIAFTSIICFYNYKMKMLEVMSYVSASPSLPIPESNAKKKSFW